MKTSCSTVGNLIAIVQLDKEWAVDKILFDNSDVDYKIMQSPKKQFLIKKGQKISDILDVVGEPDQMLYKATEKISAQITEGKTTSRGSIIVTISPEISAKDVAEKSSKVSKGKIAHIWFDHMEGSAHYKDSFQRAAEPIMIVSQNDRRILEVNDACMALFGDSISKSCVILDDLIIKKDKQRFHSGWKQMRTNKHAAIDDISFETDKEQLNASITTQIITTDTQTFVQVILHDTTQKKNLIRSLQNTAEKLDLSYNQLSQFTKISSSLIFEEDVKKICQMIADSVIRYSNFSRAVISIVDEGGYSDRIAFAGLHMEDIEKLKKAKPWTQDVRKMIFQEKFRISNSYFISHNYTDALDNYGVVSRKIKPGTDGWHPKDYLIIPLYAPDGRIIGTLSVDDPKDGRIPTVETLRPLELFASMAAQAIEKARLTEEIQDANEFLSNIMNNSVDMIITCDTKGRIIQANWSVENILGYREGEMLGKKFSEVFKDNKRAIDVFDTARIKGIINNIEIQIKTKKNKLKDIALNISTLRDNEGRDIGFVSIGRDITEQKKLEKEIRRTETYLANISANSYDAIFYIDQDGRVQTWNKGAENIFGYNQDEALLNHISFIIPAIKKRKKGVSIADQLFKTKSKKSWLTGLDWKGKTQQGEDIDLDVTVSIIREPDTPESGISIIARDVTEENELQRELIESEKSLQLLKDTMADGLFSCDTKGTVTSINPAFAEITGLIEEEIIGNSCSVLAQYMDEEDVLNHLIQPKSKNIRRSTKELTWSKDGKEVYLLLSSNVLKNEKSEIIGTVTNIKDITSQKKYENRLYALYDVNQNLSIRLEFKQLASIIFDAAKKILNTDLMTIYLLEDDILKPVANKGYSSLLKKVEINPSKDKGVVADALTQKKSVYAPDVSKRENYLRIYDKTQSELAIPLIARDRLLGVIDFQSPKVGSFTGNDQNVASILVAQAGIAVDNIQLMERVRKFNSELKLEIQKATKQLQLKNLALENANKKLTELDKLKTEFVSTVSHELRTPLTSIKGYSSLLQSGKMGHLSGQQQECMDIVSKEVDRLTDLINDVLDLSKIESGKIKLNLRLTNINDLILGVLYTMRAHAYEKNVEMNYYRSNVEQIYVDPEKFKQIMTNLINNAIKFNRMNGTISVFTTDAKDHIEVNVRDTGIGIKRKDVEKIFDSFHQVDNHLTRRAGGTGLGLPIVKKLVKLHGGDIRVESEYRKGTSFIFSIPKNPQGMEIGSGEKLEQETSEITATSS